MLNKIRDEIHENAVKHGWWDEDRHFGSVVALMHSELSEALEEYRNGHEPNEIYFGEGGKPEGIPIELADCIIRILDYCGKKEIDIDGAIRLKHEYNKTRPYRHGGKKI
jgi:NTP pyrophosphatase (non-canonical NTP hydrolase)